MKTKSQPDSLPPSEFVPLAETPWVPKHWGRKNINKVWLADIRGPRDGKIRRMYIAAPRQRDTHHPWGRNWHIELTNCSEATTGLGLLYAPTAQELYQKFLAYVLTGELDEWD